MQRSALIPDQTRLSKRSLGDAYSNHLVTVPAGYK